MKNARIIVLYLSCFCLWSTTTNAQNQPPVISDCPPFFSSSHCHVAYFDFDATDVDNDSIWFELVDGPGVIDPQTGHWTYGPVGVMQLVDTVKVRACDTLGCSAVCEMELTAWNEAPYFVQGCSDTLVGYNGDVIVTDVLAFDVCPGDVLTYGIMEIQPSPSGPYTLHPSSGTFSFTPDSSDAGNLYELQVEVSDGDLADTCTFYIAILYTDNNAPYIGGECDMVFIAPVDQGIDARFTVTDWEQQDTHIWTVLTNPGMTGSYSIQDGVLLYTASSADLAMSQPVEFRVIVTDLGGLSDTCSFFADVQATGNNPPRFIEQPAVGAAVLFETVLPLQVRDPDVLDTHTFELLDVGPVMGVVSIIGSNLYYTPDPVDESLSQPIAMLLRIVDQGEAADTGTALFGVYAGAPMEIALERIFYPYPGLIGIDINLIKIEPIAVSGMHQMEFLIGYDTAYLDFQYALQGSMFEEFAWEYFSYEEVLDCVGDCPPGMIRILMIAEIENGANHPIIDIPTIPIDLCYLVFDFDPGGVFTDTVVPLQFHWRNCDANSVYLSIPGDSVGQVHKAMSQTVWGFWYYDAVDIDITHPTTFGFHGAPDVCVGYADSLLRYIDYYSVLPSDYFSRPRARIINISPNPATLGETISFDGETLEFGEMEPTVGYEWFSSIDGILSTDSAFSSSGLSGGAHQIRFRVQDSGGDWSNYYLWYLRVGDFCDTIQVNHCDTAVVDLTDRCGILPWMWMEVESGPGEVDPLTQVWSAEFSLQDANQIHEVVINACDSGVGPPPECNLSFLYVEVTNEPPVFLSGCGQTLITQPGIEKILQLTATDTACPSDPLWYLVMDNPLVTGSYYMDSAYGELNYTTDLLDEGLQTFTVGVTDGLDTSFCDVFFEVITGGNNPPGLSWAGEPGYQTDAVEPDTGISSESYVFRVIYSDPDGDPPEVGYPLLAIDYDGDMPGSGFDEVTYQMHLEQPGDFVTGVVYSCVVPYLPVSSSIQYKFSAFDSNGAEADLDPALVSEYTTGPQVIDDAVDLFIYASMIDFSNMNPDPSESFQSNVSIFNNSFQTFTDVVVKYYMQVDYVDQLMETVEIASLAPGVHTLPTKNWQIDLPGFYPITVVIDPDNNIEEWNEDNNSAVRPVTIGDFTVPGAMDLVDLNIASTVCPGSYLSVLGVGWYILPPDKYVSTVAGAEVTVTILSTQESFTSQTNSVGGFNLGFTAPEGLGTYEVEVLVTDFTLYHYDTLTFDVVDCDQPEPTCPDLSATISLTNLPLTLESNLSTDYSVRVYNNGYSSVSGVAVRILSDNAVIASYVTGSLDPGTYTDLPVGQISYTVAGQHTVRVIVDPDNLHAECNEQNNSTTKSHYVWPHCADLAAEAMTTSPPSPYTDELFQVSVRIGNDGGLDAGSFWVMFFADDVAVDSTQVASAPGFGGEFWTSFNHSFSTTGQHALRVELDSEADVDECSETNNSLELNVIVRELTIFVDLWTSYDYIGLTNPASEAAIGQSVEFESRILNSGNDDAHNVVVQYFIDTDLLSTSTIALIPAGSSVVDIADTPWTVATGSCNLVVKIDPNNNIAESNEENNIASCPLLHDFAPYYTSRCISQRPGPMFINSCDGGITEAILGTEVTLTASAINSGAFVADGPVTARITDLAEGPIGDVPLSGLNDHGTNYVSGQLTHTFTTEGWHRLSMEIDPLGEFSDCNRSNNTYIDSIYIDILRPDLWLHSEHIDASSINPDIDEPVTFDATIFNTGEIHANDVSVAFFVDEQQLGDLVTIPVIPIENNDNYRTVYATENWIATDQPTTQHIVRVVADYSGLIEELDETNNEATRDIVVGAVVDLTIDENSFSNSNVDGELCDVVGTSFTIKNLGGQDATCSAQLSYEADGGAFVYVGQVTGIFVPGHVGSAQASIEWTMPGYVTDIQITVIDDLDSDFDLSNNTVQLSFDRGGLRPCLAVDPTSLSFEAGMGRELPESQTLKIRNMGDGLLEWYVDEQIDWLEITPYEGPSNRADIQVSINTTSLNKGDYVGTMAVTSSNADNGPIIVEVDYSVNIRPVIFLPGIMGTHIYQLSGSRLSKDCDILYNCECWFSVIDAIRGYDEPVWNEDYFDNLFFDEKGLFPVDSNFGISFGVDNPGLVFGEAENDAYPCIDLTFTDLFDDCVNSGRDEDFYGDLIAAIGNLPRYERDENFFVFPYDWRYDNLTTAEALEEFIDLKVPSGEPVDIVAHSMGGVVARLYANNHSKRVDRAVFIATPHHGSLKMLKVLLAQESAIPWILSKRKSRELAQNFLSAYQLLPDFSDGIFYTEYEYVLDSKNKPRITTQTTPYTTMADILRIPKIDRYDFLQYIVEYHNLLTDDLSSIRNPYIVAGYGRDTGRRLIRYVAPLGIILPDNYYQKTYNGDGTVTLLSATGGLTGLDQSNVFCRKVKHGDLPNDESVIQLVQAILYNTSTSGISGIKYSKPPRRPKKKIVTFSPVAMEIIDTAGNRCYYDSLLEMSVSNIPYSYFNRFDENEIFSGSDSASYTVNVTGLDHGVFSLFIESSTDDSLLESHVLYNIPVESVSRGVLEIDGAGDSRAALFVYDYDGDGIFNDTITPTLLQSVGVIEGHVVHGVDPVGAVPVELLDSLDQTVSSRLTDPAGYYSFPDLPVAKYTVSIEPLPGYYCSEPDKQIVILGLVQQLDFELATSCCGVYASGYTGNADCDPEGKRNLADITRIIDNVYISKAELCCRENGNVDGDIDGKVNLADITRLIDHVYISKAETAACE